MIICTDKPLTVEQKAEVLRYVLGYHSLETINDALNVYFRAPTKWRCAEEGVTILQLLKLFDEVGANSIKEEFDPFSNPSVIFSAFIDRAWHDLHDVES